MGSEVIGQKEHGHFEDVVLEFGVFRRMHQ